MPNQGNYKVFTNRVIENQAPIFNFKPACKNYMAGEKIGLESRPLNSTNVNLNDFVNLHQTIAFLIIRNDTILYEKYGQGYQDTSLVSSFSISKPFVSTLIGIAIDEGKINTENDKIIDYLPEFKNKGLEWQKITIKHLLHHTSGIRFTDKVLNPNSDNVRFYWGRHLRKEMLKMEIECPPETKFRYSSENVMLLAYILEKVTKGTLSAYLEEKIWKPLGMESQALWSVDRSDNQAIEKSFCCINARAKDFAKFARLYLHDGNWNGKQIVSKKWIQYSTHSNPEGNNRHYYNNNWGIGPQKYNSFYAVGLFGQFLYVYPEKNIIIVRFGKSETSYSPNYWKEIFLQIIDQLNTI